MTIRGSNRALAILLARSVVGLMFFMAGVWKVFTLGPLNHARALFVDSYAETFLPVWSLWLTGALVPFVELIFGGLLLLGLFRRPALAALGGVLVLVTFGHLVLEPLYAFNMHVMPRLSLLLFVLLMPAEDDAFSLDRLLERRQGTG